MNFHELDSGEIVRTLERLSQRIEARFPGSGLGRVSRDFLGLARASASEAESLGTPNWPVRVAVGVLCLGILTVAAFALARVFVLFRETTGAIGATDVVQAIESLINDIVFLGIGIWFLANVENRLKRRIALTRLHELRSLAHIVDMHQLTKDPDQILHTEDVDDDTVIQPMTPADLTRYLDYCTELLSLIGKMAALYVQRFSDHIVLQAVNEIEDLTTGFSRKIWQKITLLR